MEVPDDYAALDESRRFRLRKYAGKWTVPLDAQGSIGKGARTSEGALHSILAVASCKSYFPFGRTSIRISRLSM